MKMLRRFPLLLAVLSFARVSGATGEWIEVDSLEELAKVAAGDGQHVRVKPGVYRMSDYVTEARLEAIEKWIDRSQRRPPVPMFVFEGSDNVFDFTDVVWEIDTSLYFKVPQGGYMRCIIVAGRDNHIEGLEIRNTGENRGSSGNILSLQGERTTLEGARVHVHGSFPYGYGDLLGKGGPNLLRLEKQSGIQILGSGSVVKRCRVYSRAFGHCFYIQEGEDIRLEDCYAEGAMRATTEMLMDREGPVKEMGFRSVYSNRDGRSVITPGYTKSLSEDGFRTYGSAGRVSLVNCIAINTRAGFEIGNRDDAKSKTILEGCIARGCERGFLIGSHVVARDCRGDIQYGPLLYLRGGYGSDLEISLIGGAPESLAHALATVAGSDHRVQLSADVWEQGIPALPIMLGFGMPRHAEMATPIEEAEAKGVALESRIAGVPVIVSEQAVECEVVSAGPVFQDAELKKEIWSIGFESSVGSEALASDFPTYGGETAEATWAIVDARGGVFCISPSCCSPIR